MECNKQVTGLLDHLYDQRTASRHTPSVTVYPGVPVAQDTAQISQSEASDQVRLHIWIDIKYIWEGITASIFRVKFIRGRTRIHIPGEQSLYSFSSPLCAHMLPENSWGNGNLY
jgi:hypothetical protein